MKAFPKASFSYAFHILCPWNLHTERPFPPLGPYWPLYTASATGLTLFLIWKRVRVGLFSLVWFTFELLPKTVLMLSHSLMSDHWCYPASLGIFLPVSLVFASALQSRRTILRLSAAGLLTLGLVASAVLVQRNITRRGSDEGLYRDALRTTRNPGMEYNLAVVLLSQGRAGEAIPYLVMLLQESPDNSNVANVLAWAYWKNGDRPQAFRVLQAFLRIHPGDTGTTETLRQIQRYTSPSR